MDHASLEELAKSNLRLRFDTVGAQRGKRKEKVGRGVSTRQTSSQNLGNVTAIVSGKGPKLVFSAPLMVVPTHEQRTIGPAGTETALLDPNRVRHEYLRTNRFGHGTVLYNFLIYGNLYIMRTHMLSYLK